MAAQWRFRVKVSGRRTGYYFSDGPDAGSDGGGPPPGTILPPGRLQRGTRLKNQGRYDGEVVRDERNPIFFPDDVIFRTVGKA